MILHAEDLPKAHMLVGADLALIQDFDFDSLDFEHWMAHSNRAAIPFQTATFVCSLETAQDLATQIGCEANYDPSQGTLSIDRLWLAYCAINRPYRASPVEKAAARLTGFVDGAGELTREGWRRLERSGVRRFDWVLTHMVGDREQITSLPNLSEEQAKGPFRSCESTFLAWPSGITIPKNAFMSLQRVNNL